MKTKEQLDRRLLGQLLFAWDTISTEITAPGRVVIQHRTEHPQFIVHWQNKQDGGLYHGFYTNEISEAVKDAGHRLECYGAKVPEEVRG